MSNIIVTTTETGIRVVTAPPPQPISVTVPLGKQGLEGPSGIHIDDEPPDTAEVLWADTNIVSAPDPVQALPVGGNAGQILAKESDEDYDAVWIDPIEGAISAPTVDTGDVFKIILFSNGTTRAIPLTATDPDLPTGLTRTVRVNSVKLTWVAAAQATSYIIYRNGSQYATTTGVTYRDSNVVLSETYTYAVQSVSAYGLRSAITTTVSAFIDPALNIAPTCEIRTWPATIPVGQRAIIRVNVADADAQVLATLLNTDVGTLIATGDPTVWILEPA